MTALEPNTAAAAQPQERHSRRIGPTRLARAGQVSTILGASTGGVGAVFFGTGLPLWANSAKAPLLVYFGFALLGLCIPLLLWGLVTSYELLRRRGNLIATTLAAAWLAFWYLLIGHRSALSLVGIAAEARLLVDGFSCFLFAAS